MKAQNQLYSHHKNQNAAVLRELTQIFESSTPPPPVPTRSGSVRQLNNEMKSASLGRKTNPNEIDFFDKPLPDEPEKSNKRSALNRGKKKS